jgi:hypothetical protein
MPRIPQNVLNCTFFLYRNKKDARSGKNAGGTGFIMAMESRASQYFEEGHFYAVTNWHVAVRDGYTVIALKTKEGPPDIVETDVLEWCFPRDDDIAVRPLNLNWSKHDIASFNTYFCLTEDRVIEDHIGVGDDVFMIGLFADHDKYASNHPPKARFGHISMMPNDDFPIRQLNGTLNSSFILDMHSRTGFSGSPVFVYRTPGANLEIRSKEDARLVEPPIFNFLGVHWGQFPETFKRRTKEPVVSEIELEGMSGMSCAVPAWRLKSFIIRNPVLKATREVTEAKQFADPELQSRAVPMTPEQYNEEFGQG